MQLQFYINFRTLLPTPELLRGGSASQRNTEELRDANHQRPQGSLQQAQATTRSPKVQRLPRYSSPPTFPSLQAPLC